MYDSATSNLPNVFTLATEQSNMVAMKLWCFHRVKLILEELLVLWLAHHGTTFAYLCRMFFSLTVNLCELTDHMTGASQQPSMGFSSWLWSTFPPSPVTNSGSFHTGCTTYCRIQGKD